VLKADGESNIARQKHISFNNCIKNDPKVVFELFYLLIARVESGF